MLALLVRAVTLEGASKGILFFLTPQWHELSNPKVRQSHPKSFLFISMCVCVFTRSIPKINPPLVAINQTKWQQQQKRHLKFDEISEIRHWIILKMVWSKFIHWLQIWSAAIQQVFYSLSVGLCPIVVLSSHNKFNHPIYRWVTPPNSNCRYKEFNVQINAIKSHHSSTFLSHIHI